MFSAGWSSLERHTFCARRKIVGRPRGSPGNRRAGTGRPSAAYESPTLTSSQVSVPVSPASALANWAFSSVLRERSSSTSRSGAMPKSRKKRCAASASGSWSGVSAPGPAAMTIFAVGMLLRQPQRLDKAIARPVELPALPRRAHVAVERAAQHHDPVDPRRLGRPNKALLERRDQQVAERGEAAHEQDQQRHPHRHPRRPAPPQPAQHQAEDEQQQNKRKRLGQRPEDAGDVRKQGRTSGKATTLPSPHAAANGGYRMNWRPRQDLEPATNSLEGCCSIP